MIGVVRKVLACCALLLVLTSVNARLFASEDPNRTARLDVANELIARGNAAISQGDFVATELLWLEALDIYEEQRSLHGQIAAFDRLGKVALAQRAYGRAEDYQMQALEKSIELKVPSEQLAALNNLADIAMEQGLYEKAEDYYRESIALSEGTRTSDYIDILLKGLPDLAGKDTPAAFSPDLPEDILRENFERLFQDLSSHSFAYLSLVRYAQADVEEATDYLLEYAERRAVLAGRDDVTWQIYQLAQLAQQRALVRASCWYADIAVALQDDEGRSEVSAVISSAISASACTNMSDSL